MRLRRFRSLRMLRRSSLTTSSTPCGHFMSNTRYVCHANPGNNLENVALTLLQVQGILLWVWLGGKAFDGNEAKCGRLLTLEELGETLKGMHSSDIYQD